MSLITANFKKYINIFTILKKLFNNNKAIIIADNMKLTYKII